MLLEIKNLRVKGDGKEILKGIDLQVKKGEIHALLGPNGSGKSCLAQTILGNPKYKVVQGKIFFKGKDITKFPPEKRAKLGLALSWQSPPAIEGVKLSELLGKTRAADKFLDREVNVDFSGGEKKMSELLQILALKPDLAIFDEIDSGLDIKKLEKVSQTIKKELADKGNSILLITHWGQILSFLKPDLVNVIVEGKVICKEKDFKKVLRIIKKYGYEKCKKCPFLAD